MLGLQHETDRRWIEAVERDLDSLLVDHAHCELKAAQSALSLLGRLAVHEGTSSSEELQDANAAVSAASESPPQPSSRGLARETHAVEALTALAKEEIDHYHAVQRRIAKRGAPMGLPPTDSYVKELQAAARVDHRSHPALLDRILISALIEARSCERFSLLSDGLASADLRGFYRGLMASEARHYRLFRDLAEVFYGREAARARLDILAKREARVAAALPLEPTVHG